MSLIKCTECNNTVSDKAEICPHCGVKLQTVLSLAQSTSTVIDSGKLLFTTKSLYTKGYWLGITVFIVACILLILLFAILDIIWFGIIFAIVISVIYFSNFTKAGLLEQSYIELYENRITGVSSDKNYGYSNGTTFTINYSDITHIDDIANQEIIIHTTHGNYKAQAFNCVDKVKLIIQNQLSNL